MWLWLLLAILALAIVGLGVARLEGRRLAGTVILGAGLSLAVGMELLIRVDAIAVDRATDLATMATIVLAGVAAMLLARPQHS